MTTFAVTDQNSLITAVNYAISNLGATTANITGNILTLNTSTNAITVGVGGTVYSYNVPWVNIRYANNATGSSGFTTDPNNASYYGVQATANATPSTINNPASYSWNQVAGGFGTTKYLFYQAPGGRQITFDVATTKPNSNFVQTTDNVAINLDTVTTAPPTPVVIGIVYQRNNSVPTTPTGGTYDFGNLILTAPTGWANSIPTGNAPVYTSQNSFQGTTANAIVGPSTTWTTPVISAQNGNTGANGTSGTSTYTVTGYTSSASQPATPTGGSWNFATSTGVAPTGNTTWSLYPTSTTGNLSLYVSTAVASIQGNTGTANLGNTWSYPVNVGSAAGTQGARGIIPLAYIVTPSDPTVANTSTLNSWFSANRTNTTPPIGVSNSGETYTPIPGDTAQFQDYYNANLIFYGTYTGTGWANVTGQVINGNVIFPGTITANAMNVNSIYALTLSGGVATPGIDSGSGYWLQASSGNAYFGGNLVVGNSASIGSNLVIGNSAGIGSNLVIGNSAVVGSNLIVGANAYIGNNASIGGNLSIAGLVTAGLLNANTVGSTQISNGAVTASQIANGTITTTQIAGGTITTNNIAANTITGNNIAGGTITGSKISAGTITGNLIAAGTIAANNIVAGTITATQIAANTITSQQIAANTITANNISTNYVYAGNIVSLNGVLENFSSPGYWMAYQTGDARFGGNVSIGGNVSVGNIILSGSLANSIVAYNNLVPGTVPAPIGNTFISGTVNLSTTGTYDGFASGFGYYKTLAYTRITPSSAWIAGNSTPKFSITASATLTCPSWTPSGGLPQLCIYLNSPVAGGNSVIIGGTTGSDTNIHTDEVDVYFGSTDITANIWSYGGSNTTTSLGSTFWTSSYPTTFGLAFLNISNPGPTGTWTISNVVFTIQQYSS